MDFVSHLCELVQAFVDKLNAPIAITSVPNNPGKRTLQSKKKKKKIFFNFFFFFFDRSTAVTGAFYGFEPIDHRLRPNVHYVGDDPVDPDNCTKDYSQVRGLKLNVEEKKSFFFFCLFVLILFQFKAGSVMLFFCSHEHCYGGHLVYHAEGRRDVTAPLLGFLRNPPESLFYDFGCGLDEFAFNREDWFFKDVSG
jgi:hypothetical protein